MNKLFIEKEPQEFICPRDACYWVAFGRYPILGDLVSEDFQKSDFELMGFSNQLYEDYCKLRAKNGCDYLTPSPHIKRRYNELLESDDQIDIEICNELGEILAIEARFNGIIDEAKSKVFVALINEKLTCYADLYEPDHIIEKITEDNPPKNYEEAYGGERCMVPRDHISMNFFCDDIRRPRNLVPDGSGRHYVFPQIETKQLVSVLKPIHSIENLNIKNFGQAVISTLKNYDKASRRSKHVVEGLELRDIVFREYQRRKSEGLSYSSKDSMEYDAISWVEDIFGKSIPKTTMQRWLVELSS